MKKINIAFAAKDIMAARALLPIIQKFSGIVGPIVIVFAEGNALFEFKKAGTSLSGAIVVPVGAEDHPEHEGRDHDYWSDLLRRHYVDLLVVGTSEPNHAERGLALAANRADVPVVAIPDTWGAESRLGNAVVALYLAIDETHERLLSSRGTKVVVVGDPTYDTLTTSVTDEDRRRLAAYGDVDDMLVLVGQDYTFLEDLQDSAIEIMLGTPRLHLVPRMWHPKLGPDPHLNERFESLVRGTGVASRIVRFMPDDEDYFAKKTNALVAMCGATLSSFSTVLRIAGKYGKHALSVHSEATIAGMRQSFGLDHYPPASAGGPINRFDWQHTGELLPMSLAHFAKGRYQASPVNIEKAVGAILDIKV